ncbi:hypothetical protein [Rhizobium leguminosarum]|nr:hypothetical protein [Rhizobium leguminosarum]
MRQTQHSTLKHKGQPIHRDAVLSKDARSNRFIPCVSRAMGVLRLDL